MMRATKVDREPPQARNAALIAKRARRIPLHPPLLKETYTVETSEQRITNIKSKIIEASDYRTLSYKFNRSGAFTCRP